MLVTAQKFDVIIIFIFICECSLQTGQKEIINNLSCFKQRVCQKYGAITISEPVILYTRGAQIKRVSTYERPT